jgi:hypothetical protein
MYIHDIRWIDTYLFFLIVFLKITVDLVVQSVEKLLDVGLGISDADGSPLRATSRWAKMEMSSLLRAPLANNNNENYLADHVNRDETERDKREYNAPLKALWRSSLSSTTGGTLAEQ